ncbi:hypothetical protein, partial [Brevibacillus halotolerans]|uniref:hypothetical protein n=1 Tax=Brevibacillus halotolerans TaxID=1507437 RepID=UPI001C68B691
EKIKPVCSGGIPKHTGCLGFFNTVYLTGVRPNVRAFFFLKTGVIYYDLLPGFFEHLVYLL